jgi:hypothetical protein
LLIIGLEWLGPPRRPARRCLLSAVRLVVRSAPGLPRMASLLTPLPSASSSLERATIVAIETRARACRKVSTACVTSRQVRSRLAA